MAAGKGTESQFGDLHQIVAAQLIADIEEARKRPACEACGCRPSVPPALYAQAIKFLQNNGIDQPARSDNKVDTLKHAMPDFGDDNVLSFARQS